MHHERGHSRVTRSKMGGVMGEVSRMGLEHPLLVRRYTRRVVRLWDPQPIWVISTHLENDRD